MAGFAFVPYSAQGHVNPMLAVAAELVARGERVRVVAGGRYARQIESTGASALVPPIEHQVRVPARHRAVDVADRVGLWLRRRTAWRSAEDRCAEVFLADRPELLVVDPMAPWASRLGRGMGIPTVRFWTTHARSPRRGGLSLVNTLPEFQPRRHRFGAHFHFVGPLIAPVPVNADDSSDGIDGIDDSVARQLVPGRPVLLVSPGTVFVRDVDFFTALVAQFAHSEWLVLIATGHLPTAALGDLPDNVIARSWLPQQQLLEYTSVFLTHGGMNSVQEALVRAVPMLLAPRSREQRWTAKVVERLGLGRRVGRSAYHAAERIVAGSAAPAAFAATRARVLAGRGVRIAADLLIHRSRVSGPDPLKSMIR